MVNHGSVRSTVRPVEVVTDEVNVWVNSNIIAVNENVGLQNEFVGFQYDCVQYNKDEYITKLSNEKKTLTLVVDDLIAKLVVKGVV